MAEMTEKQLVAACKRQDARNEAHRVKQIRILANAIKKHGAGFTHDEISAIGYAVFSAVGRVIVQGKPR